MKHASWVIGLAAALVMPASIAQQLEPDSLSGNYFKRYLELGTNATGAERYEVMRLRGYVNGIADILSALGFVCYPDGVVTTQVESVVLKFLQEHPERLHEPMPRLQTNALVVSFPCNRDRGPSSSQGE
jgi:hypothetical protein